MSDLKYVSLNVKGINNVIKRKKILTWFKKEKTNIALLQETHLSDVEHLKLKREWVGQVYFSSFSSSKRGVAILIHKNTPFVLTKCIKVDQGRFVIRTFIWGICSDRLYLCSECISGKFLLRTYKRNICQFDNIYCSGRRF